MCIDQFFLQRYSLVLLVFVIYYVSTNYQLWIFSTYCHRRKLSIHVSRSNNQYRFCESRFFDQLEVFLFYNFFHLEKIWLVKRSKMPSFFFWPRNCFLTLFSKIMPNFCRLVFWSLRYHCTVSIVWEWREKSQIQSIISSRNSALMVNFRQEKNVPSCVTYGSGGKGTNDT